VAAKRKRKAPARARRRVSVKAYCRRPPEPKWLKQFRQAKAMPF
jgi:hypothetical protein